MDYFSPANGQAWIDPKQVSKLVKNGENTAVVMHDHSEHSVPGHPAAVLIDLGIHRRPSIASVISDMEREDVGAAITRPDTFQALVEAGIILMTPRGYILSEEGKDIARLLRQDAVARE